MLLAASTQRTIGFAILAIVFIGGLVYIYFNIRAAKPEVGSELDLAANRSPELKDEDLEGKRLDLALFANLVMLAIIAIALPFYWLGEPGREDGRNIDTARIFTNRGEDIYINGAQCVSCHGAAGAGGAVTTAITDDDGGFVAQVVWQAPALNTLMSRHTEDEILYTLNFGRNGVMPAWGGGGGGPLTDQQLEEVVFYLRSIQLDEADIRAEVDSGIVQRAEEMIVAEWDDDYAVAIRDAEEAELAARLEVEAEDLDCTDAEESQDDRCEALSEASAVTLDARSDGADQLRADAEAWIQEAMGVKAVAEEMALQADPSLAEGEDADGENLPLRWAALELLSTPGEVPNQDQYLRFGEFVFTNPAAAGTYSCARCHTYGFSFDAAERFTIRANGTTESILPDGYVQGGGFFGPNLTNGSTTDQFLTARTHAQFIAGGQNIGQTYGRGGSGGNGQMPGFAGTVEADAVGPGIANDAEFPYPALLTDDQIDAVTAYERNL